MTATIAPDSAPRSRDGFAPLLCAEWTKFRTVRGWVIAMVVAALLIAGFGIWASSGGQACGTMMPGGQILAQRCPSPALGPGGEAVTDSFYFVRQPLRGDGSLTVRVTLLAGGDDPPGPPREGVAGGTPSAHPDGPFTAGLQPWAKAGIIVAASLRLGSAYVAMLVTGGHGARMQDDYTGDVAGPGGAVPTASPRWLRLVRSGDMLTGYESADGTHWIRVGTVRLAGLPSVVPAGLFVTSPDSVTAESSSPTRATGTDVGQAVVVIMAVIAVTAEYGTGMIRATLAAVPSRTAVLAAKAAVVTGLTLAAGAVAVLGSVLAARLILPAHGLTLSLSSEPVLRAAIGTVLYLALIALLSLGVAAAVRDSAAACCSACVTPDRGRVSFASGPGAGHGGRRRCCWAPTW
jgi:hypothetical protein